MAQDKVKREEMEETILTLIEKICDKAIEEVGAWSLFDVLIIDLLYFLLFFIYTQFHLSDHFSLK